MTKCPYCHLSWGVEIILPGCMWRCWLCNTEWGIDLAKGEDHSNV